MSTGYETRDSGSRTTRVKVERRPLVSRSKALFLLAAGVSFALSVSFYFSGDHERGIYVGIWVPSILSAGALLMSPDEHEDS